MVDGRIDIESNIPSELPRVGAAFGNLAKEIRAFAAENNVSPLAGMREAMDRDLAAIRLKTEEAVKTRARGVQGAALESKNSGAGPSSFQSPGGISFGNGASADVRAGIRDAEAVAIRYAEAFKDLPEASVVARQAVTEAVRDMETAARNIRESLSRVAKATDLPAGSLGTLNLGRSIAAVERRLQELDKAASEAARTPAGGTAHLKAGESVALTGPNAGKIETVEDVIRALNGSGGGKPPVVPPVAPAAPPPGDGRRGEGSLTGIAAEVEAGQQAAEELRALGAKTRELRQAEERVEYSLDQIAREINSKNFNARTIGNGIVTAPGLVSESERLAGLPTYFKRFEETLDKATGKIEKEAGYYRLTDPDVNAIMRGEREPRLQGRTPEDRAYALDDQHRLGQQYQNELASGSARNLGGGYGQLNDATLIKQTEAGARALRGQEERTNAEDRLRRTMDLESNSLRIGRGLREGLFSRGFGANGLPQNGALPGLGTISENLSIGVGNALKYGAIYSSIQLLSHAISDTKKEFLDYNDSITDVNVALGEGSKVGTDYVLSLQNITRVAGSNVGEAMDVAARGIRAFGKAGDEGSSGTNKRIGADVADAASQLAVIANKPLKDAAGDVIAIGSAFGIAAENLQQVNDAIANAKQLGGDPSNISQGLANFAVPAKEAGFSLNQAAAALSLVIARTDESGATAATRLSRITAIFGTGGNQAFLRQQGVDTTATVKEQIEQLAVAYQHAGASEQAAIRSRLGGTANLRELLPLLDANNQLLLQNADANAKAGAGQSEFDRKANALAGTLKKITGDITAIQINLVNTDIFAPLLLGVRAMEPVLHTLGDLLGLYDRLPGPLKTVIALTAEFLLLQRGLRALSAAGGFGGALNGTVQRVREIGNPALAAQNAAAKEAAAAEAAAKTGTVDAAAAARAEAEANEVTVILDATAARATAEAASVTTMRASQAEWTAGLAQWTRATAPTANGPIIPPVVQSQQDWARGLPQITRETGAVVPPVMGQAEWTRGLPQLTRADTTAANTAETEKIAAATTARAAAEGEQVTVILDAAALRAVAEGRQNTAVLDASEFRAGAEGRQNTVIVDATTLRGTAEGDEIAVVVDAAALRAAAEAQQATVVLDAAGLRAAAEAQQATTVSEMTTVRARAEADEVVVIEGAAAARAEAEALSLGQMRVSDAARATRDKARAGLNSIAPGALAEDVSAASIRNLGAQVRGFGSQAAAFASSFAGMLTIALVATQIINSTFQVGRRINKALEESQTALEAQANLNDPKSATTVAGDMRTAAAKDRQASEGIIGSFVNWTRGDATGKAADGLENRAASLELFSKALDRVIKKAARSADAASAIDVSSGEGISNGLKLIADEGGNATDQFNALITAMQRMRVAAGGLTEKLTPIDQQKFSLNLGQTVADSIVGVGESQDAKDSPARAAGSAVGRTITWIEDHMGPAGQGASWAQRHLFPKSGSQKAADAIGKVDLTQVSLDTAKVANEFQAAGGDVTKEEDRKVLRDMLAKKLANDLKGVPEKARNEILDGLLGDVTQALTPLLSTGDTSASLDELLKQGIPVAQASGARAGLLARTNGDERGSRLAAAQQSQAELATLRTNVMQKQAEAKISPEEAARQLHQIDDELLKADAEVADATNAHLAGLGELMTSVLSPFDKTGRDQVALASLEAQLRTPGLDQDAKDALQTQINNAKNTLKQDQISAENAQFFSGTITNNKVTGGVDPRDKVGQAQATLDAAANTLTNTDQFGIDGKQTQAYSDALTAFRAAVQGKLDADLAEANAMRDALVPVGDKVGELLAQAADQIAIANAAIKGSAADKAARRAAEILRQQARDTQIHIDASVGRLNIDPRDEIGLAQSKIDEERKIRNNIPKADVGAIADADFQIKQDELAKKRLEVARTAAQRSSQTAATSPVQTAATNLQNAIDALALELPGTTAYFNALTNLHSAEDAVAAAALAAASTRRKLGIDLTDPVAAAAEALQTAQEKLAADKNKPQDVQDTDRLAVIQAQTALEGAQFQKNFNAITVADQLGRVTHATYLNYLQNEHNRLTAITDRTYQQQQELDQVDQAIKAANDSLQGQFNLGDIKVPSVYEVRRSIAQDQIGVASNTSQSNVNTTNSVVINGADLVQVKNLLIGLLGANATSRFAVAAGRKL